MKSIVFLDRDGVVNIERGEYTWRIEDFKLTVGLIDFIRSVQQRGYLVIIISNQGGIGRGVYTLQDVEKAHHYLLQELGKHDLTLTDIYFCPHHPSNGKCLCRKPGSVMLEKAIARYEADVKNSYFIGDSKRDIEAGQKVNLNTILIHPNDDLREYLPQIK